MEYLCEPEQTLLDVLRDELDMTGSKEGCASGDCGACSVLLDGRLVCACLVLGAEMQGRAVETIEGMADGAELHPLQQKFLGTRRCSAACARRGFWSPPRRLDRGGPDETEVRYWLGAISAGAPATTRSCAPC